MNTNETLVKDYSLMVEKGWKMLIIFMIFIKNQSFFFVVNDE